MKNLPASVPCLERIFSISHEIIANPSLEDILHSIVHMAADLVNAETAGIMLSDVSSNKLNFVAVTQKTDRLFDIPVPIDHSVAGATFTSNRPLIVNDVAHDPRYYPKVDELLNYTTHSIMSVPLTFRERKIGVLQVVNKKQGRFTEEDVDVLVLLAAQATITIEIARLYRQAQEEISERTRVENELRRHQEHLEELVKERTTEVHRLAITDSLTGLFTRRQFMLLGNQSMQEAQRYHTPFTAMMVDLDHFKKINDTFGHAMGDTAIRTLADILRHNFRTADIIGRYGGDEFVILMPHTNLKLATELANRLLAHIRDSHIDIPHGPVCFTASIGLVEMDQACLQTLDSIIDEADHALYAAKHAGRNQLIVGHDEHHGPY